MIHIETSFVTKETAVRKLTCAMFAIVALSCLASPAMAQRGFRGYYGPGYGHTSYYGGYRSFAQPYTSYYGSAQPYGYSNYGYPINPGGYQTYAPYGYAYPVNPGYGGYYSQPGLSFRFGY